MPSPKSIKSRAAAFLPALLLLCSPLVAQPVEGYTTETKREVILRTSNDAAGRPFSYPQGGTPEITGILVTLPPGANTGWHTHPSPCVAYILEGEISLELEGRPTRIYKAGDSIVEVVNLPHRGTAQGDKPVKILFFAISEKGTPIAKPAEAPH